MFYTENEINELKDRLIQRADIIKDNINKSQQEIELMRNQSPTDEGDYAVLINDNSYSLSRRSFTISMCSSPRKPHLKPKPSAAEVSGS